MSGRYSRVYWSIRSDPKFADVYRDARRLGTWLQLLIAAEAIWPEPADLPRTVSTKEFRALVDCGLLVDLGLGRYRVNGLDHEREARAEHAATASSARWSAPRNAASNAPSIPPSNAQSILVREEHRKSRAEQDAREDADPADAYWSLTGRYPVGKPIAWIDDMAGKYGQEPTTRAMVKAHMEDPNTSTLLGRTQNILAAEARALDRKERADEQQRLREKRAMPKPLTGPDAEFKAMLEARYARGAA